MKIVIFENSSKKGKNTLKFVHLALFFLTVLHGGRCGILSSNQINVSLFSKSKRFSKNFQSLVLVHPKRHSEFASPEPRNLAETSELAVINNQPKIKSDDYDEVTGITKSPQYISSKNRCNRQVLNNYLISGYDSPKLENHLFCPNITYNCCSEQDQKVTMENWNNVLRQRVQKYYTIYINSIRYVLGFYGQLNLVASNIKARFDGNFVPNPLNSSGEQHQVDVQSQQRINSKCMDTAKEFLEFKFDRDLTTWIVNSAVRLTNAMTHLRSSFFCTLCDGQAQEMLSSFWKKGNANVQQTLFFSKDFCADFVTETIDGVYNYIFYLRKYLDGMKSLIDCHLAENTSKFPDPYTNLRFYLSNEYDEQAVKDCFYKKEEGVLLHCEKYCGEFNMSKVNKMLEGDTTQLFKFVNYLSQRRESVFENQSNIFTEDPSYLSQLIADEFEDARDLYMFFLPSHQKKLLDVMKTDVVSLGGINPFDSGVDNMYNVVLKGAKTVPCVLAALLVFLWRK